MVRLKVLWLLFVLSTACFSHDSRPAYLRITEVEKNKYDILWKVPQQNEKSSYMLHVMFDKGIEIKKNPIRTDIAGWHIVQWQIYAKNGLANRTLTIRGLSSTEKEVLLHYIDKKKNKYSVLISPNHPEYLFPQKRKSGGVIQTYLKMGVHHILSGTDHLLFVACLVMIANTFSKLLWTITGFTLAHSITLLISALGWVHIPIPPLEAMIALSIIFLAVEIIKKNTNTLTYRYPAAVSSSFGLLHGFGFASALMEIGLPAEEKMTALLFFNIGVEFGQIFFVILLFLFMWSIRKIWKGSIYIQWKTLIGYTIGAVASMWLFERVMLF